MFSKRIKKKIEDVLLNTHTSKFHIFSATTIGSDSSRALFQVYSTEETTKQTRNHACTPSHSSTQELIKRAHQTSY
jgi:hypothetical protein